MYIRSPLSLSYLPSLLPLNRSPVVPTLGEVQQSARLSHKAATHTEGTFLTWKQAQTGEELGTNEHMPLF